MRRALGFCALVVVAIASGCTLARINARGAVPVMMNNPHAKVDVVKHVETSKSIYFDFSSSFDASEILASTLAETKADAIINVGLTVKTTPGNFFVNFFTLGLANAKTLVVSADAVKTPAGLTMSEPGIELLASGAALQEIVPALAAAPRDGLTSLVVTRSAEASGAAAYKLYRCPLAVE